MLKQPEHCLPNILMDYPKPLIYAAKIMLDKADSVSRPFNPDSKRRKAAHRIAKITPAIIVAMLVTFIAAMINFLRRNAYFWFDDFVHFIDAQTKTLPSMMASRVDIHFAPLHQLLSFILFKFYRLNFDVSLIIMGVFWIGTIAMTYCLLRQLSSDRVAGIITLIFGTNTVWFHTLIWWSGSAHRLPSLFLLACALLTYLRYRRHENASDAFLCILSQLLALGFYAKAIQFPLVVAAFELCLAPQHRRFSHAGIMLCLAMGVISVFYVAYFILLTGYSHPAAVGPGFAQCLPYVLGYISQVGCLLLFLPLDQPWAIWIAAIFWITLACYCIYRRPSSGLPIMALLILMTVNFSMSVWGRGWLLIASPQSALRYYSEVLVMVAVFAALVITPKQSTGINVSDAQPKLLISSLLLSFVITYPIASYFSSQHLFQTMYTDRKLTRKFMINAQIALEKLSEQPAPQILQGNLPVFAYGYLAARLSLQSVFEKLYPHIEWVAPEQAKNGLNIIQDDGHIAQFAPLETNP